MKTLITVYGLYWGDRGLHRRLHGMGGPEERRVTAGSRERRDRGTGYWRSDQVF